MISTDWAGCDQPKLDNNLPFVKFVLPSDPHSTTVYGIRGDKTAFREFRFITPTAFYALLWHIMR